MAIEYRPMPNDLLLLGAGFSRNWGGWLADEAFEYLLGAKDMSDDLRNLLWRYKDDGGFEAALTELQNEVVKHSDMPLLEQLPQVEKLAKLEVSIGRMFDDMNRAFVQRPFEFGQQYSIGRFLARFEALFTLNQDLLIEHHYIGSSYLPHGDFRWRRCITPGIEQIHDGSTRFVDMQWSPMDDPAMFSFENNVQPYFKLHGSSNWIDTSRGDRVLVIGGNKPGVIDRHPILKWNHEQFKAYLSKPATRLMVIGYSFRDDHINEAIGEAAKRGHLQVFIIDPHGVDVLERPGQYPFSDDFFVGLRRHLIGASRRPLSQTFGGDLVEHGKVMRFFE
jgi:hypothetical protein